MHFVHLEDNLVHLIKTKMHCYSGDPNQKYYRDVTFSKTSKLNFFLEIDNSLTKW